MIRIEMIELCMYQFCNINIDILCIDISSDYSVTAYSDLTVDFQNNKSHVKSHIHLF
jgi:hypothetical protein